MDAPTIYRTAPLFAGLLPVLGAATSTKDRAAIVYAHHFAGLDELAAAIPDREPSDADNTGWSGSESFTKTASMAEARTLARDGWRDGAERARKLRDGITATIPQAPRLVRYDVAGTVPNVARHLAGNPMTMRRPAPADTAARPILTIVARFSASATVPASTMENQAAAIAAIVDILEGAGFLCEVIAHSRAIGRGTTIGAEISTRLKAPGEPLNLGSMAFGLGHPSMLRRLWFAIVGMDSDLRAPVAKKSMGLPVTEEPTLAAYLTPHVWQTNRDATAKQCFVAICDALRAQGCPGIPDAEALAHLSR